MSTQSVYRYSHSIGFMSPMGGAGFSAPVDLVLDREGLLYVLNRCSLDDLPIIFLKRVTICTVEEEFMGEISLEGTSDGEMMWPVAIAMDKDENIYISDEALHRIAIFDKQGQFLDKWGVKGKGDGEFDRPAGIAFDKNDDLLVVDGLNNRVQRFTKHGRFLGGWGRSGTGDGEFNMPWGISLDQAGNVLVADWRNDRIQKFDSTGTHLATWGTSGRGDGEFYRPAGVTTDQVGNVYVADWGNERVQVLGPDGSFRAQFRGESQLSKWTDDYWVSNGDELEARLESDMEPPLDLAAADFPYNQSAAVEKLFWGPTSVKVDERGWVYVVDSLRQRIQIYRTES